MSITAFKILISGLILLFLAIIFNVAAKYLGLMTWYDYLNVLTTQGSNQKISFTDYAWLFLIYPICLGLVIYACSRYIFQ